jgi:hypothetical protein
MKVKDTNFLQQHLEKIILGAAVLFALVVLWFYAVGQPYGVSVAQHHNVAPAQVPDLLLSEAERLRDNLESQKSPLPSMSVADYTDEFRGRMARSLLPFDRYVMPLAHPGLDLRWGGSQAKPLDKLAIPTPPGPFDIQTVSAFGVLVDQPDPQLTQEFVRLIGAHQPRDFRYVSIGATFDMAQWAKLIQQTPADERIPENWWNTRRFLTAVVLQRQTLDPATGNWSEPITIAALPTGRTYGIEAFQYTPAEAAQVLDLVYFEQELIKRPPFPLTTPTWFPPGAKGRQLSLEDQRSLAKLQREITEVQDRIKRLTRNEPEAPGAAPAPTRPIAPPPVDEFARPGAPPRPATTPRPSTARAATPTLSNLERAQQNLAELTAQFNQLRGIEDAPVANPAFGPDMAAPAPGYPGYPGPGAGPVQQANPDGSPAAAPDNERMTLWAHDLTVQPGQTYRYRVVAYVFNPLFQRKEVVPEQRDQYFNQLALASTPSDWSAPVAIDPVVQFFLVKADPNEATIEVWRIHNGQWVHQRFRARPGDPLGGVAAIAAPDGSSTTLDLSVNALAVDLRPVASLGGITTTYQLLYYDPATGSLLTRSVAADLNSNDYVRLQAQAAQTQAPAPAP